jgi:uncharacterized delta-60 repeat protein
MEMNRGSGCVLRNARRLVMKSVFVVLSLIAASQSQANPGRAGTLDDAFGVNGGLSGIIPFDIGSVARAIAIQPDEKIVMAGYCLNFDLVNPNLDFCLARLNPDGSPDSSFGGPFGVTTTAIGSGNDFANAIAIQPDGKIVVAGWCANGVAVEFCVARYLANGQLDTTFGSATGKVSTSVSAGDDYASTLAIQPDGKIVVAGYCNDPFFTEAFCAIRLQSSGVRDTTFGTSGAVVAFPFLGSARAREVLLEASGNIILAGHCNATFSNISDYCFARLSANGTELLAARSTSVMTTGGNRAAAATLQADGKVLVAGFCSGLGGSMLLTKDLCVVRFNVNGSLDTSFDEDGLVASLGQNSPTDDSAFAIALQADQKIVLATRCSSNNVFCAYRFGRDGSPDSTFGNTGRTTENALTDQTLNDRLVFAAAIQPDGKLLLAGACDFGGINKFCAQRYDTDCSLDLDASGAFNPTIDGAILVRSMLGFKDAALTNGISANPAAKRTVTQAASYRNYCKAAAAPLCNGDIDGDGSQTATIDALIAVRAMLGLTGSAAVGGINFPVGATRNTWPLIRDHLVDQCAMTLPQ